MNNSNGSSSSSSVVHVNKAKHKHIEKERIVIVWYVVFFGVGVASVYCAMANEEDEVRTLLMRHRKQIIREINESELISLLTQKNVLTAVHQKQLNDLQNSEKQPNISLNNAATPLIKNKLSDTVNGCMNAGVSGSASGSGSETIKSNFGSELDNNEKKCIYLIDVIARSGFEKFKEFCYAIESECPKLIGDLIHDQLNGNNSRDGKCSTTSNTN